MPEVAEVACLGISSAAPVPGTDALSGSAGYESDAGAIVLVRGLELQGAQLTYAAQHHWQHKAVQPSRFCTAHSECRCLHATLRSDSFRNMLHPEQYRIAICLQGKSLQGSAGSLDTYICDFQQTKLYKTKLLKSLTTPQVVSSPGVGL